ncbi:polymer-forming cytoskeletal protein [Neisseriaceae bacterium CLB008]|nr:polymer-forming cytoskeletal protein [Neisseriaceae bacterium]
MGVFRKRSHLGNDKHLTIVAVATTLKGEINSDHMVQIDGVFEGLANSQTRVMISEGGVLTGEVVAQEVSVFGNINGKITANKVIIGHKGLVNATIIAEHLVIMEGGRYIGEKKEYASEDAATQPTALTPLVATALVNDEHVA